ncbi:MAG: hypothetical protein QOG04_1920, partial [Actinomycetota bacterium]|nr:hypothetical protein [Actinomycetota bacterium]
PFGSWEGGIQSFAHLIWRGIGGEAVVVSIPLD